MASDCADARHVQVASLQLPLRSPSLIRVQKPESRGMMKALVIYDSVYGNTEKIATAIGKGLTGDTKVMRVSQVDPAGFGSIDMLIVGSPTLGGRPTEAIQSFLSRVPDASVRGIKVASFDTRYSGRFVKVFGFAADKIAENLKSKGGDLRLSPEPFYVTGKKGPLKEGELERAATWGKSLVL